MEMNPLRPEVRAFTRSCEQLLAATLQNDHRPFSDHEKRMIDNYNCQVARLLDQDRSALVWLKKIRNALEGVRKSVMSIRRPAKLLK